MTTQNEGDLGRSISSINRARTELDFGLKSQMTLPEKNEPKDEPKSQAETLYYCDQCSGRGGKAFVPPDAYHDQSWPSEQPL